MNDNPPSNMPRDSGALETLSLGDRFRGLYRSIRRRRNGEASVRDTLDELIEEREESELPIDPAERLLLANILELRGRTIRDVMVPRADIVAVPRSTGLREVIDVMTAQGHSRLPIYGEALDDASGMVHAKDILAWRGREDDFVLSKIQRRVLFVAPSMQVLELLLEMRVTRTHMALVVDEFGGVDGLVTIEDLVEEIVGEIEDEHDRGDEPHLSAVGDRSFVADARCTIETMMAETGLVLPPEEVEDIDTLGGLVFAIAGRVPIRGEIITSTDGLEFEILDADPRRIKRLKLTIPASAESAVQVAD